MQCFRCKASCPHQSRWYQMAATHLTRLDQSVVNVPSLDSPFITSKGDWPVADAKAKARGLHNKLTSRHVMLFGHPLWDIVIVLAQLSLFLQAKTLAIADIANYLDSKVAILETYAEHDLIESLQHRFDMAEPLIAATGYINKQTWPSSKEDSKDH
ncbi:uncharacterized protein LOC105358288 [Oryzias latipes]